MKKYKYLTQEEKEIIKATVCDHCNTAACWHGLFYCDRSKTAGIWQVPIYYLEQYEQEHPEHWEIYITAHFQEKESMNSLIECSLKQEVSNE